MLSLFRSCLAAMLGESAPGEEASDTSSALAAENAHKGNKLHKGENNKEKNKRKLEQTADEPTDQENNVAVAASVSGAASASGAAAVAVAAAASGANFTEDQAYLMVRMLRLVNQLTQGPRHPASRNSFVAAVVFDTFLAPSQDVLISAMTDQGRRFAKTVENPGYREGSPHLDVFGALLEAIADMDLAPLDKKRLEDYEKMTVEQRALIIQLCLLAETYDDNYMPPTEMRKIALAFGNGSAAQAYKERVQQVLVNRPNWTYKVGKPPPTYQKSEMSRFLAQMAS
jgi:hypothetical protein